MRRPLHALACLLMLSPVTTADALASDNMPWDLEALTKPPSVTWIDKESPVHALTYSNVPFKGEPTEVFAYYATPGSISGDPSKDRDLPAVVLLHGGGGTAFAEWAWLWAKRGYAAIAMDLSGRRPTETLTFEEATGRPLTKEARGKGNRTRLEKGGPEADARAKFLAAGGDVTDDWQYHAVAAAMGAHSLLRSFDEVDPERTAVTGISWGGYLTCLVASVDDRFKAAVPVYGCGYIHDGESVQRGQTDRLTPQHRRDWVRLYEPSVWLPRCEVPIFFVNGTNDIHYPLDSYSRSYDLIKGERYIRIEPMMGHSHPSGWAPKEIGLFIDQKLRGGDPLPTLSMPTLEEGQASTTVTSPEPIEKAEFHYTTDDGRLAERKWHSVPAERSGKKLIAAVPEGTTIWLFTVTDPRGAMISTDPFFLK
ncbi:Alpha/beta hydrolase family protein [Planctomycetes bacterium Pan216]|uniref:Alpha/beta hydrolase family protein n=1 Tax=Kolteria novifilia TaxID=2527975 RepID=A0A518B9H4_9BACT|nr:Alpha/beta hydrolase family protein [Planctomycetes bacterium Pan216]